MRALTRSGGARYHFGRRAAKVAIQSHVSVSGGRAVTRRRRPSSPPGRSVGTTCASDAMRAGRIFMPSGSMAGSSRTSRPVRRESSARSAASSRLSACARNLKRPSRGVSANEARTSSVRRSHALRRSGARPEPRAVRAGRRSACYFLSGAAGAASALPGTLSITFFTSGPMALLAARLRASRLSTAEPLST
ncbi:MAG: hypothetical protein RL309_1312 [Verrucomicrobiota bacterium]